MAQNEDEKKRQEYNRLNNPDQYVKDLETAKNMGLSYDQLLSTPGDKVLEYNKNKALVESQFSEQAKKKKGMLGRPETAQGSSTSLYNQTGTGLYTV